MTMYAGIKALPIYVEAMPFDNIPMLLEKKCNNCRIIKRAHFPHPRTPSVAFVVNINLQLDLS